MESKSSISELATQTPGAWLSQMSTGDWISAAAAFITAIGVLWAIYQHISSQKMSAKLAVLDRRRSIYDRLRDVLLELNSSGDDIHSVWVHANHLYIDSEHLFHHDVRNYLKLIAEKISKLDVVSGNLSQASSQDERVQLAGQKSDLWSWLTKQHEHRATVFKDYLKLP